METGSKTTLERQLHETNMFTDVCRPVMLVSPSLSPTQQAFLNTPMALMPHVVKYQNVAGSCVPWP